MSAIDVSKYAHSLVHKAVVTKDYDCLRKIIADLPQLCDTAEIVNESIALSEEAKADAISAVIDCRDVPNRETPLHMAVKLGDELATEMLMLAGANCSLRNEQGWNALQEAICNREEKIARIIVKHKQPIAWAKRCRRLPLFVATFRRMRDFYMEITFQFESSVIPFISRIAPSDTYKIWKTGANLRADLTLAGFDGFKIQRSDQSIVFFGDGSEDGKVPPGTNCMIKHKDKEVINFSDGAGAPASDSEVQQKVTAMSRTNISRPGINVTKAVLLPQMTWRRQEKAEMVGSWKAKVYDMHNVVMSIKSRRVPGAMTGDELLSSSNETEHEKESGSEELDHILTEEERRQLEVALKSDPSDIGNENSDLKRHRHSSYEPEEIPIDDTNPRRNGDVKQQKKGLFDGWRKRDRKHEGKKLVTPRGSLSVEDKVSDLPGNSPSQTHGNELRRGRDAKGSSSTDHGSVNQQKDVGHENEYKIALRPVLWLSPSFPLRTEELLPLLDILANKVKAIRRLRELLTTKLPTGTFPVKVALPVISTIRVLVTFTKFEELQPLDEFSTPPTSPTAPSREKPAMNQSSSSSSWFQWIKTPYHRPSLSASGRNENIQDPFAIPSDYTWITAKEKKKRMQEKHKSKKGRNQNQNH